MPHTARDNHHDHTAWLGRGNGSPWGTGIISPPMFRGKSSARGHRGEARSRPNSSVSERIPRPGYDSPFARMRTRRSLSRCTATLSKTHGPSRAEVVDFSDDLVDLQRRCFRSDG